MKIKIWILFLLFSLKGFSQNNAFITVFETSNGLETATYTQTIQYYTDLAKAYPQIAMQTVGHTDSGYPLHLITLNPDAVFDFSEIRKNKRILLVNNGIHPGESDGIDATMMLYRDIVQGKITMPTNTVLVAIPIYNIGGSLNRNTGTRANQNGPKAYGFRGNSRNFDLNRDFIKSDTRNAEAFAQLFHLVQPDVFIDNHVSNGADYQYTLTHLFTQHNKMGGDLGTYINTIMRPELERKLEDKDWDITPYVNVFNSTPEKGFSQFMDYPRYSTGYTTLFNTFGMMVETHMLKPYKPRVEGTYELMKSMLEITEERGEAIAELRKGAWRAFLEKGAYPIAWELDKTKSSTLQFKGFEGEFIPSEITGQQRLKYDSAKPFTKDVNYQNHFKATKFVDIPKAYIIPQGWHKVIHLLKLNGIVMEQLQSNMTMDVESYRISSFETRKSPYEGHYQHYNTQVNKSSETLQFRAGDYKVSSNQPGLRYLLETLEPEAPDSFFNWNFFDTVLQQKEGFSPYVFEDEAKSILDNNAKLKGQFEAKKASDTKFRDNWYAQLNWIFERSHHYEKAHMQYPIYRLK